MVSLSIEVESYMKLILIMICDGDKERVQKVLLEKGYTPTFIATTGEFLEYGKSLLLLGVEEDHLKEIEQLLSENTKRFHIKDGEQLKADMFVLGADIIKGK